MLNESADLNRTSWSAINYMFIGYRSTPHPATGYSPYEALIKGNVRTMLHFKTLAGKRDIRRMEKEITKRNKEYKKKWDNHHPMCKKKNTNLR